MELTEIRDRERPSVVPPRRKWFRRWARYPPKWPVISVRERTPSFR
jgi:hypothetical protein